MIETGVLLNAATDEVILWHLPPGRTSGSIPDSRTLWENLWANRHLPLGFAHSHPGEGPPGPSNEDVTTFQAIEQALGKRMVWWIMSKTAMIQVLTAQEDDSLNLGPAVVQGGRGVSIACTIEGHPSDSRYEWVRKLWKLSYAEGDL